MAMIFQRAMKRLLSPVCALAALMASAAVSSLEWDFAKTAEDRAFMDVKPEMPIPQMVASEPPVMTASARPRTSWS